MRVQSGVDCDHRSTQIPISVNPTMAAANSKPSVAYRASPGNRDSRRFRGSSCISAFTFET